MRDRAEPVHANPLGYVHRMITNGAALGALCLVGATLALGCATTTSYRLTPPTTVAAASGTVTVSGGEGEDSQLSIQVQNLAEPSNLTPGASTYVAWVAPLDAEAAENVGTLQVEGRSGSLSTVTPLRDFIISITPEIEARAIAPCGPQVLSVIVHRRLWR